MSSYAVLPTRSCVGSRERGSCLSLDLTALIRKLDSLGKDYYQWDGQLIAIQSDTIEIALVAVESTSKLSILRICPLSIHKLAPPSSNDPHSIPAWTSQAIDTDCIGSSFSWSQHHRHHLGSATCQHILANTFDELTLKLPSTAKMRSPNSS